MQSEKSPSSDDTLELHSSHIKMEMDEYDQKIKNQTLAEVEKIIESRIKNIKENPAKKDWDDQTVLALYLLIEEIKKIQSPESTGKSEVDLSVSQDTRKGCDHCNDEGERFLDLEEGCCKCGKVKQ